LNCQESHIFIQAYADEELALEKSLEVEEHLKGCPICSQEYERIQALRSALRKNAPSLYFKPSEDFSRRLRTSLKKQVSPKVFPSFFRWPRWGLAASLGVVLLVFSSMWLSSRSSRDVLIDQVVAGHVRSLMGNHLTDVASTDQHTVKPWFNGRVDFSPMVKDFSDKGFALIGGRLDYLQERPVAALVFQRRQHFINLFSWPGAAAKNVRTEEIDRRGYHLLHWEQSGMNYWLISDLDPKELKDLSELLRNPT
jgi:anti-sigma factor RsiW